MSTLSQEENAKLYKLFNSIAGTDHPHTFMCRPGDLGILVEALRGSKYLQKKYNNAKIIVIAGKELDFSIDDIKHHCTFIFDIPIDHVEIGRMDSDVVIILDRKFS